MINFRLKTLEDISPAGRKADQYLSWYYLTDGELWMTLGNATLYKYSKEVLAFWQTKPGPYYDYYLVRFIEDFTELFGAISESVPDDFYGYSKDVNGFLQPAINWLDKNVDDEDEDADSDIYFDAYDSLTAWISGRSFTALEVKGGPFFLFCRNGTKIRITWQASSRLENGISIWTAGDGSFEMDFDDFVSAVKEFGRQFFEAMDKQIKLAVDKDWKEIIADKRGLIAEHEDRRQSFYKQVNLLQSHSASTTDWERLRALYSRIEAEVI